MADRLEAQTAYRDLAVRYCDLIENRGSPDSVAWVKEIHLLLPRLYAAALALPSDVEPDTDTVEHDPTLSHEEWQLIFRELGNLFARWNHYFDVFDPYDEKNREAICGSLSDDLADIYHDVRSGLRLQQIAGDTRPNDVLWSWKFNFESHWAAHATGAMRALQTVLFVYHADALPESFGKPASISGEAAT